MYPRECPQPMREEYLLSGYLEPTNEPYAIAKLTGAKMCEAYNRQYKTKFICAVLANVYGPNDHFDAVRSHVVSALLKKFQDAVAEERSSVTVWGTGTPRRDFIFVDDVTDACLFLMETYDKSEIINIGYGNGISIKELASCIQEVVGFKGEVIFDTSKPDGALDRVLDSSRLISLGWRAKTPLGEGIRKTYNWFLNKESLVWM